MKLPGCTYVAFYEYNSQLRNAELTVPPEYYTTCLFTNYFVYWPQFNLVSKVKQTECSDCFHKDMRHVSQ